MSDDENAGDAGAGVDFDKITALMANFYGVGELDDDDVDDFATSSENIDSASFDASEYVLRAVKEDQLSDLLRADEQLITEVQELNNDMQNLVYENYNKFISATDTIRKMKDQVEGMENEIETLISTMDSAGTRSTAINKKLQPKRERVENIQSLQRLIKRLEFLFELPLRLKRSIELEAYTQAVKYYNMASGILEQHSEVASFGAIQVESNEIMSTLKTRMYEHLGYDEKVRPNVLSENIRLLIDLGESKKSLSLKFLDWHEQRLRHRVESLTQCFDDAASEIADPYQEMWRANRFFLSAMNVFLESHDELFGGRSGGGGDQKEEEDLSRGHHKMVQEVFAVYFRVLRGHLLRHPLPLSLAFDNDGERKEVMESGEENGEENGFHSLLSALGRFKSELRESSVLLRSAKLRLGDRAAEIIENTIRAQMNRAFMSLRIIFQKRVEGMIISVEEIDAAALNDEEHKDDGDSKQEEPNKSSSGPPGKSPSKPPSGPPSLPPAKAPAAPAAAAGPPSKPPPSPKRPAGGPPAKAAPTPAAPSGNPFGSSSAGGSSAGNPFGEAAPAADDGGNPFGGGGPPNKRAPAAPAAAAASNPFQATQGKEGEKEAAMDVVVPSNPFGVSEESNGENEKESDGGERREAPEETETRTATTTSSSSSTGHDGLVASVRSIQETLVSDIETTLSVLQSLLRDATTNHAETGRTLSRDMVHIFVHLMRAEFDSLVTWFATQAENKCDGVGTNRHSCEVTGEEEEENEDGNEEKGEEKVVSLFSDVTRGAFQFRPRFVLATAFLFRNFAAKSIGYMTEVLASSSVDDEEDDDEDDFLRSSNSDSKLKQLCKRASHTLLTQYVGIKARESVRYVYARMGGLSRVGQRGGDDDEDDNCREEGVETLALIILEKAAEIGVDASSLLGGRLPEYGGKTSAVRNGPTPGNRSDKQGGDIQLDIDRIFAKKVTIYGGSTFTRENLLQEYFRIVFKSFSEHSRSLTFTTLGFQACLIAARYLYDVLPSYCDETESLDYLLTDWINSVSERCINPIFLNEERIESVVGKMKSKSRRYM